MIKEMMIYADKVLAFYKRCNNGESPKDKSWAEVVVREYNAQCKSYKTMFGESIRGKVERIAQFILDADEPMTIARLRKIFPGSDFYFFRGGFEVRKAPFYHAEVKDFRELNERTIFIELK